MPRKATAPSLDDATNEAMFPSRSPTLWIDGHPYRWTYQIQNRAITRPDDPHLDFYLECWDFLCQHWLLHEEAIHSGERPNLAAWVSGGEWVRDNFLPQQTKRRSA